MSLPGEWTDRQKYVFKRTIEELGSYRGMGTQLVTLYIPPTRQISDAMQMLRDEVGQASNIKSKQTQTAVSSALTSMMARLKTYKQTPENGLALFVGEVSTGNNKSEQVAHVIEPPAPVQTYQYRCDSTFNVEPLQQMTVSEDAYGLMIIDRKEVSIGYLKGKTIVPMYNRQSQVPSKHGRGGQSAQRFERLIDIAAHEWFTACAEKANELFLEQELQAILLGGPGPTKEFFHKEGYLHHELRKRVHPTLFDTGYTDEDQGLKELVDSASTAIQGISMAGDRALMQRFLKEMAKPDAGLAEYGEPNVREALLMGAVEHLLVSEDLRRTRCIFTNSKTGEVQERTVESHKVPIVQDEFAKQWGGNAVDLVKKDLVEDLSDLAEQNGSEVHIVSSASEEGGILRSAFGGVVALLRYRYN